MIFNGDFYRYFSSCKIIFFKNQVPDADIIILENLHPDIIQVKEVFVIGIIPKGKVDRISFVRREINAP